MQQSRLAWLGEHSVLSLYWALSGYGLRSSRSLAWLVGILAAAAVLFASCGLEHRVEVLAPSATTSAKSRQLQRTASVRFDEGLLSAAEAAISLPNDSRYTFSTGGRFVKVFLRVMCPLLIALALLAMRGRVKR
jgi:hypothetical protein